MLRALSFYAAAAADLRFCHDAMMLIRRQPPLALRYAASL